MIIERHMYCSLQEFFDVLVEAVINDIYVSTNQKITKSKLKKGYAYSKYITNKKNQKATATIKEYEEPKRYSLEIVSKNGRTLMDYTIKELNDHTIKIIYKEEYRKNNGKMYNNFFYKHSVKKRMSLYFSKIESYIKNSR